MTWPHEAHVTVVNRLVEVEREARKLASGYPALRRALKRLDEARETAGQAAKSS